VTGATILLGGEMFTATEGDPFVFGRGDSDGIVGLDADDMGISAEAGSVERDHGLWWVVNRSRKRRLLLELEPGQDHVRLACGVRHAVTRTPTVVLVPGAVYTHRLEVHVPADDLAIHTPAAGRTSSTITQGDLALPEKDRLVLAGLFSGYLRPFPRRDPRPLQYGELAELLGGGWTQKKASKHVERIKERFAKHGVYFEGLRANEAMAEFVLDNGIVGTDELADVDAGAAAGLVEL
jgi:hypothetical protein